MKKKYPIVEVKEIKPWFLKKCCICEEGFKEEKGYKRIITTFEETFDGFFAHLQEIEDVNYFCKDCYKKFDSSIKEGLVRI